MYRRTHYTLYQNSIREIVVLFILFLRCFQI